MAFTDGLNLGGGGSTFDTEDDEPTFTTTETTTSSVEDDYLDDPRLDPDNYTGGYDPNDSESGIAGGGATVVDVVSPDPNEDTDGDAVVGEGQEYGQVITDRLEDVSMDQLREQVSGVVGDVPQVPTAGVGAELRARLEEWLSGLGRVTDEGSRSRLLVAGAAVAALAVITGVVGISQEG